MFSGLVAGLGRIRGIETAPEGARIEIGTDLAKEIATGDSVAVNGACLTATSVGDGSFTADAMNQTLSMTSLGSLEAGDRVNLELALRAGDRLGGHIVQGHVDGVGKVVSMEADGFSSRLRIALEDRLLRYTMSQGSITIEGVSLTVSGTGPGWIEVSLIPETLERTSLGSLSPGRPVNVECDVIARYVERMVSPYGEKIPSSDEDGERPDAQ
jgi:riboflavin synthase